MNTLCYLSMYIHSRKLGRVGEAVGVPPSVCQLAVFTFFVLYCLLNQCEYNNETKPSFQFTGILELHELPYI